MITTIRHHISEMLFSLSYFIQDFAETVGGYSVHLG